MKEDEGKAVLIFNLRVLSKDALACQGVWWVCEKTGYSVVERTPPPGGGG